MNRKNPSGKNSFKLKNLFAPLYIFESLNSLTSFSDLRKRAANLLLLAYKIAFKAFKRPLKLDPENGSSDFKELKINSMPGCSLLTAEEIAETIKCNFNNEEAYRFLGDILARKKQYKEALDAYNKALEFSKGNKKFESGIHEVKAQVYFDHGEYGLVVTEAEKAISLYPENEHAYMLLGRTLSKKNQYREALDEYNRALEFSKGDKEFESSLHKEKAQAYLELGNYDSVVTEAEQALSLCSENAQAYLLLGKILGKKKQFSEALDEFRKALLLSKGDKEFESNTYKEKAQIYFEQAEPGLAEAELVKAIGLCDSNIYAHILLGSIYVNSCKYNEALSEFKIAIELNKGNDEIEEQIRNKMLNLLRCYNLDENNRSGLEIEQEALGVCLKAGFKYENMLKNELEIANRKTKLASNARVLNVCLTNKCNLRCKMCNIPQAHFKEISQKVRDEIVGTFPCLEEVTWCGGEAFLYSEFNYLLDKAVEFNVKQSIITNGLLISEAMAAKLIKNNIRLVLSIDGTTKDVYEAIRKGARFGELTDKLAMLNRLRLEINPAFKMDMIIVVMKSNYHQIESFVEFAREHKIGALEYFMIDPTRVSACNEDILFENKDDNILHQIERSFTKVIEDCKKYNIGLRSNITKELLEKAVVKYKNLNEVKALKRTEVSAFNQSKKACFGPWKTLSIDIDGNVKPFAFCLCANNIGNLNKESMENIWNGDNLVKYREKILSGEIEKICNLTKFYSKIPYDMLIH